MRRLGLWTLVLLVVGLGSLAEAQEPEKEGVAITIYNQNFGVVKDSRFMELAKGVNTVRFQEVASQIDPTSVHFKSLTAPGACAILEQNYEFDLVSANKLLEKYIDKPIEVFLKDGRKVSGFLMSYDYSQLVLAEDKVKGPLTMVTRADNVRDIRFSELPEGLITKPTLVWMLGSTLAGKHLCEVAYMTRGVTWKADYTAIARKDDTLLDLSAWLTIDNKSGATYKDAKIKVIAGDVHRVEPRRLYKGIDGSGPVGPRSGPMVEEKAFAEYHMYTVQKPSTLKDKQMKQIELFPPVSDVPVKKLYIYRGAKVEARYGIEDPRYGTECNKKVNVMLEFDNAKDAGLGIPLPMGKVRVYKRDEADDSLEFIGEDAIDHTPREEKVKLYIGNAFDIVGERKQTNFRLDRSRRQADESFEIKVRNRKEEDTVTVEVIENLYRWVQWEITEASHEYEKVEARTIKFPVTVDPDEEAKITYTVHYTW